MKKLIALSLLLSTSTYTMDSPPETPRLSRKNLYLEIDKEIDRNELRDLIISATTQAIDQESKKIDAMWEKRESAHKTHITTLICTVITYIAALIIHARLNT